MASFVANGHPVDLYAYDEIEGVPPGVRIADASSILARDLLFRHRRTGSVALFADWFRYRLLHERGGIWVDTDVVCLKPLQFRQPEIYAWQDEHEINIAVLGLPAGHPLSAWMQACCESPNRVLPYDRLAIRLRKWRRRVLQGDRRGHVRWGEYGPKGFTAAAKHLGYDDKALAANTLYPVSCEDWRSLFESARPQPKWLEMSHAVHLWNNMLTRTSGFDKDGLFAEDSPYETLQRRFVRTSS